MYLYDEIDQRMVDERVEQFRDQTRRYLAGKLSEDEFRPLRLRNGLYIQRHAPMLRVAIPYGMLSARQLRKLAHIARAYDRGVGHFSTRQNMQFNWPRLEQVPDILGELAAVQMHSIQTSGNCVRNITSDHFAGVAPDEIVNPLVWCEVIRQWATFNPEFNWLPRKFKIAVNGAINDRSVARIHDIGLNARRDENGEIGFQVLAGGGLGRTPMIGDVIREFLPRRDLLTYLDAILRVYNRYGRRDNIHKARIKILVRDRTAAGFRSEVEEEWSHLKDGPSMLTEEEVERIAARFTRPRYRHGVRATVETVRRVLDDPAFDRWCARNVHPHKVPGYAAVTLSLKRLGMAPGDVTADEMEAIASLAERYSFGELRVSHEQNVVFTDVLAARLPELWSELRALRLATPNVGLLTNIISCPGGDFCSLANAKSIPVAASIQERFDDLDYVFDVGDLDLNISGCMNACGHHHVGHIGILGVDKNGEEWYQVEIGGSQGEHASLGKVLGRAFAASEIPEVIERLVRHYVEVRDSEAERFIDAVRRLGVEGFRQAVYGETHHGLADRHGQLAAA